MGELSLFVCATPRSGSYYLLDQLCRWGLPMGDEWLAAFHQSAKKWQYGKAEDYPFLGYLELLSKNERQDGILVTKMMPLQWAAFCDESEAKRARDGLSPGERLGSIFPNPKFILLCRRNRLEQAISHVKARQTGHWVKRLENESGDGARPVYSYLTIRSCLQETAAHERAWEAFFEGEGIVPFRMDYEDLLGEPAKMRDRLGQWLGFAFQEELDGDVAGRRFRPMAGGINAEWRERFLADESGCLVSGEAAGDTACGDLELEGTDLGGIYIIGGDLRFTVRVKKRRSLQWVRGMRSGEGWWRVAGLVSSPFMEEPFQFELRPESDGRWVAEGVLPVPKQPCRGTVKLVITRRNLKPETIEQMRGPSYEVAFAVNPERAAFRELFAGAEDLANGWRKVAGFGCFLDASSPWIYHADHEWLYVKPQMEAGGAWHVFDTQLGWLEVKADQYPMMRLLRTGEWLTFVERRQGHRYFRKEGEAALIEVETNGREHLRALRERQARKRGLGGQSGG